MALIKFALLLSIVLQGCALTSTSDGLLSAPDVLRETHTVCEDCTQTFEFLADLFSDRDLQKKVMNAIESLCDHLPAPASKVCKDEVEKMLPLAISFITGVVKPAQVCKLLLLCGSCDEQQRILHYFFNEAFQAAVTNENILEALLPKEMIENAVIKQLQKFCNILPFIYQDQCEAIIKKYSKMVLEAIQTYTKPQTICTLIGLCQREESAIQDPCTLTTHRCRDIKTAVKCGTLFYCQKSCWKPLNYNTL
ncbi:prosaposin isoform X2 [Channa argus]|uniref:prosaposin isoform X2 n=1 Tax=Channa argus TaxID=215402 RepID=UPI0035203934